MICEIADLIVDVPEAGGLAPRCKEYICGQDLCPDIVIREEQYRKERYPAVMSENAVAYMESGYQFCMGLLRFQGMYLHSSAVVLNGKAYLFSGHCGAGKSTHARLWKQLHGEAVQIINDDKPALRQINGIWYAYGTPWCGKDGINKNEKAPLAGICFVKKADHNRIRRLSRREAMGKILAQTIRCFPDALELDRMLGYMESLLEKIPVYELENLPEEAAAKLSCETMCLGAQEAGL